MKKYLTVEQVADRFGLNLTTVYRLAQQGALPGFKIGSQWRFSEEMLESWVADRVTIEWLRAGDRQTIRLGDSSPLGSNLGIDPIDKKKEV